MARYTTPVTSVAAIGADTPIANIVASANSGYKLRRLIFGCKTTTAADPSNRQISIGIYRTTARGTQTATTTPEKMDPGSPAAAITGVDTAWSANPTLGAQTIVVSFNTQGGADVPYEGLEEFICANDAAKGILIRNLTNALPANHQVTVTIEHEE